MLVLQQLYNPLPLGYSFKRDLVSVSWRCSNTRCKLLGRAPRVADCAISDVCQDLTSQICSRPHQPGRGSVKTVIYEQAYELYRPKRSIVHTKRLLPYAGSVDSEHEEASRLLYHSLRTASPYHPRATVCSQNSYLLVNS